MSSGKIAQVVGPVVDVMFASGDKLPEINNALIVYKDSDKKQKSSLKLLWNLVTVWCEQSLWNQLMGLHVG